MKTRSITQNKRELNHIMTLISKHATKREEVLVAFMYRSGFTVTEIAKVMGVTRQEVSRRFPYKKYVTTNEK